MSNYGSWYIPDCHMPKWNLFDDFWDFFGWLFFHEQVEEDEERWKKQEQEDNEDE